MACELPDTQGRSLSQWDCTELARQVVAAGLVGSISAATVRRVLKSHQLKPWRYHLWLSAKVPRDKTFISTIRQISRLYTCKLKRQEMVLCLDEKTSLQPRRPRKAPTRPAQPQFVMKVEHEYERSRVHSTCLLPLILAAEKFGDKPMNANVKMSSLRFWSI